MFMGQNWAPETSPIPKPYTVSKLISNYKLKISFKNAFSTGVEEDRQMLPIYICKGILNKDTVFTILLYVVYFVYIKFLLVYPI